MKTIKFINVDNCVASTAKEYVKYLKDVNVMTDIRLKPGIEANNSITFYYPDIHTDVIVNRINDAIIEIFDDYDEQIFEIIYNRIKALNYDETLIWDNVIGNFID